MKKKKKTQIALVTLYFFPSFFFPDPVFSVYYFLDVFDVFYVQSMYRIYSKQYMSSLSLVPCIVLFSLLLFLIYL